MAKHTTVKATYLSDEVIQHTKYRWEFLRRNPEYINEWHQIGELSDDARRQAISEFSKKWRCAPHPPNSSYDEIVNKILRDVPLKSISDVHEFLHEWMIYPNLGEKRPVQIVDGWEYDVMWGGKIHRRVSDNILETGKLKVEIDLGYSKNQLFKDFKRLIDEWKLLVNVKIEQQNVKNYHFDNFDDYLKVYDLKKEGMSWAKIAKTLKLNSVQTARNYHKAACELIEKGIDLYVK